MRRDYRPIIREIPDFPKPGVSFKDITPLLIDRDVFHDLIDDLAEKVSSWDFSKIACIESRGFLFGAALAYKLRKGLVITRKKGKLPYKTMSEEYELEYGMDSIEMHIDAINKGERVLVFDDLIATGGTALATGKLVEKSGGIVSGFLFIIELAYLKGVEKLAGYNVEKIIVYD